MSRIEAVHVRRRRREGGSQCSLPLPARPAPPKAALKPGREKQKPGERTKSRRKTWQDIPKKRLTLTEPCRVLPPKDGLKITLKAINADNGCEKRNKSIRVVRS